MNNVSEKIRTMSSCGKSALLEPEEDGMASSVRLAAERRSTSSIEILCFLSKN